MAMKFKEVRMITGLTQKELIACLLSKKLIKIINKNKFSFHDPLMNEKFLLYCFHHGSKHTLWKHEAKEFLTNIAVDCREELNIIISSAFMDPSELPFIRNKEYLITIVKIRGTCWVFNSDLGTFFTKRLGKKYLMEEGKKYIINMQTHNKTLINDFE